MGLIRNSTIFLALYVAADYAVAAIFKFITGETQKVQYYSLSDMYEEYTTNNQDLSDVFLRIEIAWQAVPLLLAFYIAPRVRKCF